MKLPILPLIAAATGITLGGTAYAQNTPQQRGFRFLAPGAAFSQNAQARANLPQTATGLPRAAAAPVQVLPVDRNYGQTAPRTGGVRYAAGNGYPASLFGQFVQGPGNPSIGFGSPQYAPQEVAQGASPGAPPSPGYGPAGPGAPQAGVGNVPTPGSNPAQYGNAPPPAAAGGLSPIYAYSGRYNGPYYGNGMQYYGYGGCCGWGSPYNSLYYNSGCYGVNACCRSSRRFCTPFGGMGFGCGSGCYAMTPPPCPTVCDPCYGSAVVPGPGVAPPTYVPQQGGGAQPQPMPPTPEPPGDTPPPPQPSVKPAPQASNFRRVPIFPRIPSLPET